MLPKDKDLYQNTGLNFGLYSKGREEKKGGGRKEG